MEPCAVHVLLHGDHTPREVKYCDVCDAVLCDDCRGRYDLRAVAAIKDAAQRVIASMGLMEGGA